MYKNIQIIQKKWAGGCLIERVELTSKLFEITREYTIYPKWTEISINQANEMKIRTIILRTNRLRVMSKGNELCRKVTSNVER